MKNLIIFFTLLMLFGFSSVYAQETQPGKTKEEKAANLPEDPKLSPEERLLPDAGEDNPARIDNLVLEDPRMDPKEQPAEEDYGEANAKPAAEPLPVDPKLDIQVKQAQKGVVSTKTSERSGSDVNQPPGDDGGAIPDYRNMQGGTDQPTGDAPNSITNYKDKQGPGTQPPGDRPDKK